MKISKILIVLLISAILCSCYTMGQDEYLSPEIRNKALGMRPTKKQSFVYIYRKRANVGTIKAWPLIFDGRSRSNVKNSSFVLWVTTPGEHTVMSREHENEYNVKPASVTFIAEPGKSYYFRHNISMDFKINMKIIPEQEFDAMPYIKRYQLNDLVEDR